MLVAPSWICGDHEDSLTTSNVIISYEDTQRQPRLLEGRPSNIKESVDRKTQPQCLTKKTNNNIYLAW